jgi:hypothetical protein
VNSYLATVSALVMAALPLPIAALPLNSTIDIAQNAGQPVASINPSRPVQIEVVNAGGAPVTCRLTQPPTDDRRVLPGSSVTFGSTQTSYLPLPIYFLISPEEANIGLSLYVSTEANLIRVVVAEARSDIPGSTSLRVDANGGVYVY